MKNTTGGTFHRSDPFVYFLAAQPYDTERIYEVTPTALRYPYLLFAVNELEEQTSRDALERLLDRGVRVLMDSGIFALAMAHARLHGVSHDVGLAMAPDEIDGFARLWDRYAELATTYGDRLWGIIELDQGGAEVKPETRARIESEIGITPIPVYHPLLDGWDYYDSLATEYDRLCVGNIVMARRPIRTRLLHTMYERARKLPDGGPWHHFLGLCPNDLSMSLPLAHASADSTFWLVGTRWAGTAFYSGAMGTHLSKMPRGMWHHRPAEPGEQYRIQALMVADANNVMESVRAHHAEMAAWA